jgi:peptidoglycan/LPS O-acetylase OafA/YrhL
MLRRIRQAFPARLSLDNIEEGFIPSLDGLRGLAILMVIGFHYLRSYLPIGWAGVDLFFVLSGFLITRILLQSKEKNQSVGSYFRNFYARRTLRIFPIYYAFLVLILFVLPLVFGAWYDEKVTFYQENQAWFWTYMENWLFAFRGWGESTLLSHFWSLAIEEQFYLFWPLLVYFFSLRSLLWASTFLVVLSLVWRNVFYGMEYAPLMTYTATFARLDALGVGTLLAILLSIDKRILQTLALPFTLLSATGLFFGILIAGSMNYWNEFFVRAGYGLLAFFFGGLLLLALSGHGSNFFRWLLSKAFFRWSGRYSYGLYVIHYPAYYLVEAYVYKFYPEQFSEAYVKAGIAVAGLLITIPLALLSYRFLELPFLRLKRYFV